MTIDHYENFPVASFLLPAELRPAVRTIYAFARSADDFADEGELEDSERLALLKNYEEEIKKIESALPSQRALFIDLRSIIEKHQIPTSLFLDLLSAFKQDITIKQYGSFDTLLDYCRRSANPVGRIMLHLFNEASEIHIAQSDDICTALQLINFWQDVELDLAKGRVYLPQEDLDQFEISNLAQEALANSSKWRQLMQFEIDRARDLMLRGAPLAKDLPGRFGIELRMVVQGGLRILQKIEDVQYDVFKKRPTLKKWDGAIMMWHSLTM
ncbi:squalene synthase HpnC [Undibacterium cyanobacteriorum]|uniref:Squalene synthase HpnC n=1 Tax=Undibacterium cyanobacteriorum TaxID=3073561 RepID=A0ABY9RE58_9BURK|nr:squalene synthase HpnC [Undibacterium sp. 20NA77.5]WMW79153.1 squalene synthase HpnC [Undibacterium sp. 20NA77.5]